MKMVQIYFRKIDLFVSFVRDEIPYKSEIVEA